MKKQLLSIAVSAALFLCNYCFGANVIDTYIATSTNATATELNTPTNLKGTGLQVVGQSSSPYDIKFTWNDNSTNEDGYKFQREKVGIYWDFGCETGANATSITHHLSFMPEKTEKFRLFSYENGFITKNKSPFAYATVEMLRADLTVSNSTISSSTVNRGAQITISCQVNNIGTYPADPSTLGIYIYNPGSSTGTRIGTIAISALAIGANSGTKTTTVTIPNNCMGNCTIKIEADAGNDVPELSAGNNCENKTLTVLNADLTIISPLLSKTTVKSGESITASCNIKNIGTLVTGASTLKYYISKTTTGSETSLGSSAIGTLGSDIFPVSKTITIPSLEDGTYYIVFYADADGTVTEGNENNNKSNVTIKVDNPKPYYEITSIKSDSEGPNFWTAIKVKNTGPVAGTPTINIGFIEDIANRDELKYVAPSGSFDPGWLEMLSDPFPFISISASKELDNYNWIWAPYAGGTTLYIIAYIKNHDNKYTWKYLRTYISNKSAESLDSELSDLENQDDLNIMLYPNPCSDFITLKNISSYNNLEIINSIGKVVKQQILLNDINESTIDLSGIDKGLYIIKLSGNSTTEFKKFIKE